MELIIATHNENKVREFTRILSPLGVQVRTAELEEVEETGQSFAENARLKAIAACKQTGLPCIADDSGLCIDALNGAPGIYSARYDKPGQRKKRVLKELNGLSGEQRSAHFTCAICCAFPSGLLIESEGICEGQIADAPRGENGFGYDPIFLVREKTFAELSAEEKDAQSHRSRALRLFAQKLEAYFTYVTEDGFQKEEWDFSSIRPGDFAGCMLCTDIDGTLVIAREKKVPLANVIAAQKFVEAGGLFTISSGRSADYVLDCLEHVMPINAPIVSYGGALCVDKDGSVLYESPMQENLTDIARFVFTHAQGMELIHINLADGGVITLSREHFVEEIAAHPAPRAYKFLLMFDTEEHTLTMQHILEQSAFAKTCDICRSWPVGLEILDKHATKGEAVAALKKQLGAHTTLCIGDYENDYSMLRDGDIGVAVENGLEKAKQLAGNVVGTNTHGAIADAILQWHKGALHRHTT